MPRCFIGRSLLEEHTFIMDTAGASLEQFVLIVMTLASHAADTCTRVASWVVCSRTQRWRVYLNFSYAACTTTPATSTKK